MLWKQAATGMAIGGSIAIAYNQFVARRDMDKIAEYYAKQDASASKQ